VAVHGTLGLVTALTRFRESLWVGRFVHGLE